MTFEERIWKLIFALDDTEKRSPEWFELIRVIEYTESGMSQELLQLDALDDAALS